MDALLPLFQLETNSAKAASKTANLITAARTMATYLNRSRTLDRKAIRNVMEMAFGASDAQGAWSWRDAYDAVEAAIVLSIRRLSTQVGRLEDAPVEIVKVLAAVSALTPTHTRRSEEQIDLDQFSTPPELAAIVVAAAQIRKGDQVLEPSAGTGLLAIIAETCGAELALNEVSAHRSGLLDGLFPSAMRTRHDAAHLADLLPKSGSFDAVITNPPFQVLEAHLGAAIACLADGGRLAALVPTRLFDDVDAIGKLERHGKIVARIAFPARAYARHGTSVETGLIVLDRGPPTTGSPPALQTESLTDLALHVAALESRATAKPRLFREGHAVAIAAPRPRDASYGQPKARFLSSTAAVNYETKPWAANARDIGLYSSYSVARMHLQGVTAHPSALVESTAMGSTPPPAPTYRPVLPVAMIEEGLISDAQLEAVIYAGEAHAATLPGLWKPTDAEHVMELCEEDDEDAVQFRRGYYIGDGTGVGKGRICSTVIADNMAQGRTRAVWISKNEALLEDARRDWTGIGGAANDLTPQSAWKQSEAIAMERGILFTTYATLRQAARGAGRSRLQQITDWLGAKFEGVIVFDEAHALANAAGVEKGARGAKAASAQGRAGLALQNQLPSARILYVSATGATTPENLAYASRLGLWGGPEAPFNTRSDFLKSVDEGGVAVMELIARELKAGGLYNARSLSFEGVEYEPLTHELTPEDVEIWDAWADAYQLIHANLREALKAIGVCDEEGKPQSPQAASAAKSAFEGTKLRFFAALLSGLKAPSLIRSIRQDLEAGHCSVVQVVSTNEAVLERRLAEIPVEEWNNLTIDLTPKDMTLDYLMSAFPTTAMTEVTNPETGDKTMAPLLDENGQPVQSQAALALRDELYTALACLPAVPGVLDCVIEAFGTDEVAEITGRSRRIVVRDGRRIVERRSASAARSETEAFMAGRKRILVFSDAGGTGRSYHACNASAGKERRRIHYLAEPGWRADTAIQGLGRTHRTNQASTPLFRPVTTNIKGEKRFLSTIARRLNSLGALTRGERRSAGNGLFRPEDNLESSWAHRALLAFYRSLAVGEITAMTMDAFEQKTALQLTDQTGSLLESDQLPAMHTWLNRILALRIDDQNLVFAEFDDILGGILRRAEASGSIDRGMEDVVADEVNVVSEEVIRTDTSNGAETRIVTFDLRRRRDILTSEQAYQNAQIHNPAAITYVVNSKSGAAGVIREGITTTDDQDKRVPAVMITTATSSRVSAKASYEESAWEPAPRAVWSATWDAHVASLDPWKTSQLAIVTGVILPIWRHLSGKTTMVRRVTAADGRRWLGRVLSDAESAMLKVALGLTTLSEELGDATEIQRRLLAGEQLSLAGGLYLRSVRAMDRKRIEINGVTVDRHALRLLGCLVEVVDYTPRVFIPLDRNDVLEGVLRRHPIESIVSRQHAA